MAHVLCAPTHRTATCTPRRITRTTTFDAARTAVGEAAGTPTLEDRLLAHLDAWMNRHPAWATLMTAGSLAALTIMTVLAMFASIP